MADKRKYFHFGLISAVRGKVLIKFSWSKNFTKKGLTYGFWRLLDHFLSFEIKPKCGRLGRRISFSTDVSSFRRCFDLIFVVEKFHQKVKRLTHGCWRFFDHFQSLEIRSKDGRLADRISFSTNLSDSRRNSHSIFEVEKFHQKVKGLTHGFWRFFDHFLSFDIKPKCGK